MRLRRFFLGQGAIEFWHWMMRLIRQPMFLFVTLWGHTAIILGAFCFHFAEHGKNPREYGIFQAYFWAISTATTVGSNDVAPVTVAGKFVAVAMMVVGALFLWCYTALFASALVSPVVKRVDAEIEELEKEVKLDTDTLQKLLKELETFNRQQKR